MAKWSIPLAELADKVKLDIEVVARKVMLDVFNNVLARSPVDLGTFRSNWVAGLGAPVKTTTESTDQSNGAREAVKAATFGIGGVIYFTNSLPYAIRLENGWSKQAPAGMVKLALADADRAVKRALK
ncbi:MAG: HK97 gp10 family phage protein [Rubrivivax sp.]|nr:MAG: HK97 gp10 family phage protein [Rubrivivax sp.]